jgi:hypothetical protein
MNLRTSGPSRIVLIVGIVLVLCLCVVFVGGRGLLGNVSNLLGGSPAGTAGDLGRMYTASDVDREGCPLDTTTRFDSNETIFVGLDESRIPAGSELFVRLYYEGSPVEDTRAIRADQDMRTCVWFQFEPTRAGVFDPGTYEAELYVDGNPADSVQFQVSEARAGNSGLLPGTGSEGVELGRVYASSNVDRDGCPVDSVSEFYPDEPVYVSIERSYIPRGSELFARLYQDGRAVEDTAPIRADQNMETCVWFVFESGRGSGLQPGQYEAEIFVNGEALDYVEFVVR